MAYKDPLDERARAARRKHYDNNKQQYKDRSKKVREEMRAWIAEIKAVPCMDCKQSYPSYVMDMDHRVPSEKVGDIGAMITKGSWSKLKEEVDKCDIICANCHRERTHGSRTG